MSKSLSLDRQCELAGLGTLEPEYVFARPRRWRFDYALPAKSLAIEVEGGAFSGGRHTRGSGFIKDMEKYNTALLLGWRVLRVTPQMVKSGEALTWIERALQR
jgi:hypothetical protein